MTATENAFGKCCLVEPASGKGNSSTDKKQTNKKKQKRELTTTNKNVTRCTDVLTNFEIKCVLYQ